MPKLAQDSKLSNTEHVAKQRSLALTSEVSGKTPPANQHAATTSIVNRVVSASSAAADTSKDSKWIAQVNDDEQLKAKNAAVTAKRKARNAKRAAKKKANKSAAQSDNTSSLINPAS